MRFACVALIGKYQSTEVADSVRNTAAALRARGHEVLIEQGTASALGRVEEWTSATYDEIGQRADLALVIGGDGTLLGCARRLVEYDVPLVGVNQGRVGFLTDIACTQAAERLTEVLDGHFVEDRRTMLLGEIWRGGEKVFVSTVLNDIVLGKGETGRMIEFDVSINEDFVYTQRSDGMIIATPTGSTAYALAANGPILHPAVPAIALVPLCPEALSARPVTLPDSCEIRLTLHATHEARAHFDGQTHFELRAGDAVFIRRSPHVLRLVHPPGGGRYFAMLREKLHWSAPARP